MQQKGESSRREIMSFGQKTRGGLLVDVCADFTSIIEKWLVKGYKRKLENRQTIKIECLESTSLSDSAVRDAGNSSFAST